MVDSTNLPGVDINAIATDLNNKMDRDGVNASCPVVISRVSDSNGGVTEIWSDGYCVQTGISEGGANLSGNRVTFAQPFINELYTMEAFIVSAQTDNFANNAVRFVNIRNKNVTGFNITTGYAISGVNTLLSYFVSWRAEGYIR